MQLDSLSLINFKNYQSFDIQFSNRINGIIGNNGQGKTNLLDAIYYLSFCKSFFNPVDVQNIKSGEEFFVVQGQFQLNNENLEIYCGVKKGQNKVFKRNKKEYEKLADHIGNIPLVMISPADTDLITEGSEVRRKFIDGIIAQFDRVYLDNLQHYQRVVKQRNAVLKQFWENRRFDEEMLSIYNAQLAQYGSVIYDKRVEFLKSFLPIFTKYFQWLTASEEEPSLKYESKLNEYTWEEGFSKTVEKDRISQFTNFGIHKDDLELLLNGMTLKRFGSQGQQKTYVIALKLAQYHCIKQKLGNTPILLLDDIFDKIDQHRVHRLMELINEEDFGQIFITDTEGERLQNILDRITGDHKIVEIKQGEIAI